jgi:hypothetical protein
MRIEPYKAPIVQKHSIENPAWEPFFSKFSCEVTSAEKKAIINHFIDYLSHLIHRQMQRMIDTHKKMRWE